MKDMYEIKYFEEFDDFNVYKNGKRYLSFDSIHYAMLWVAEELKLDCKDDTISLHRALVNNDVKVSI